MEHTKLGAAHYKMTLSAAQIFWWVSHTALYYHGEIHIVNYVLGRLYDLLFDPTVQQGIHVNLFAPDGADV